MADRWFARRGERIVLIARCLPIIRTFISLPAGIARMPFWRFTLYTAVGSLPWVLGAHAARRAGRLEVGGVAQAPRGARLRHRRGHHRGRRVPGGAPEARHGARMRRGLPGEERLLEWAHRRAFDSRLRPAPADAGDRRPLRRLRARLRPARPARAARGDARPRAARHGRGSRGLDPQRRAQAARRAPAPVHRPLLVRDALVSRGAGDGARRRGDRDLAELAADRARRPRLRGRGCRGAARLRRPLAERPARRVADRRPLRIRSSSHRRAPCAPRSRCPFGE